MKEGIVRIDSFNALKEGKLLMARSITCNDVTGEIKARKRDERAYWNDILHEYELRELEEIRAAMQERSTKKCTPVN